MKLTVVHLEGSKQGLTENLTGAVITIGRDPSNMLSFDPFKDLDVSSRHASITQQGQQVMLQDLGSTNGTFLNGSKVAGPAVALPNGCMLQFGDNGPKLQLSYTFDEGPGKKTRMIHDLRSELDAAGLQAEEAKKSKAKSIKVFLIVAFLALVGFLIYMGVSHSQAQSALKAEAEKLQTEAATNKARAETAKASDTEESKPDWDKAVESLATAEKAYEAENWQEAKDAYLEAAKGFSSAASTAQQAQFNALQKELADKLGIAARESEDARKKREAKDAERIAALKKKEQEAKDKLKRELLKELQAARGTTDLLQKTKALEKSKNPDKLKAAVDALKKQMESVDPTSPEAKHLSDQIEKLQANLKNVKGLTKAGLAEIAKSARPKVVQLHVQVFALQSGQTLKTTRIKYPVAEGHGSGFYVSKTGHVVTAKEVVKPELFDGKALARKAKLKEKGASELHRVITIKVWDAKKKHYAEQKGLTVQIAREFPESKGKKQTVEITFDKVKVKVEVSPQARDDNDVVVLKVDGLKADAPIIEMAPEAISGGLPCLVLGIQEDEKKKLSLFMFDGKAKEGGKVLSLVVPSFKTWLGGPVLDPNGKVVGVLVAPDDEEPYESKAVGSQVFKDVVAKMQAAKKK